MKIQLALDRLTIEEAIKIAEEVRDHVDWIEVGTSLIKEFGIRSVSQIKSAFPEKPIVADIKTIDNAKYEMEMCFQAGADVATVMGVSPLVTIELALETATKWNKKIMIDLLNISNETQDCLLNYDAILCNHLSKDMQEHNNSQADDQNNQYLYQLDRKIAVAGGITLESFEGIRQLDPHVVIIGSAITKAEDRAAAAQAFQRLTSGGENND